MKSRRRLKLLPRRHYRDVRWNDPLRFYFFPILGPLYRRRVELCLTECRPGHRVLEVGFGSGVAIPTLDELYDEIHGVDMYAHVEEVGRGFAEHGIETDLRKGDVLDLPYDAESFDTVLLISVLEHLQPHDLPRAFREVHRVLRAGGQLVYGVPVERRLLALAFRGLGYDIREHHFSTERQVAAAARASFEEAGTVSMRWLLFGKIYEVGHFTKSLAPDPAPRPSSESAGADSHN